MTRTVDATIGPRIGPLGLRRSQHAVPQLRGDRGRARPTTRSLQASRACSMLRDQTWLLGPSAAEDAGVIPALMRRLGVPEERQQIFQSHAAALEETKRGRGLSLTLSFTVAQDLAARPARAVAGPNLSAQGAWNISTLRGRAGDAGGRGDDPLRHHAPGHPGDAARPGGRARPLPARRPRHALELTRRRVTDRSGHSRGRPRGGIGYTRRRADLSHRLSEVVAAR